MNKSPLFPAIEWASAPVNNWDSRPTQEDPGAQALYGWRAGRPIVAQWMNRLQANVERHARSRQASHLLNFRKLDYDPLSVPGDQQGQMFRDKFGAIIIARAEAANQTMTLSPTNGEKRIVTTTAGVGNFFPAGGCYHAASGRVYVVGSNSSATNVLFIGRSAEDLTAAVYGDSFDPGTGGLSVSKYDESTEHAYFLRASATGNVGTALYRVDAAGIGTAMTRPTFRMHHAHNVCAANGFVAIYGWVSGSLPQQHVVTYSSDLGVTWNNVNVGGAANAAIPRMIAYSELRNEWIAVDDTLRVYVATTPAGPWNLVSSLPPAGDVSTCRAVNYVDPFIVAIFRARKSAGNFTRVFGISDTLGVSWQLQASAFSDTLAGPAGFEWTGSEFIYQHSANVLHVSQQLTDGLRWP